MVWPLGSKVSLDDEQRPNEMNGSMMRWFAFMHVGDQMASRCLVSWAVVALNRVECHHHLSPSFATSSMISDAIRPLRLQSMSPRALRRAQETDLYRRGQHAFTLVRYRESFNSINYPSSVALKLRRARLYCEPPTIYERDRIVSRTGESNPTPRTIVDQVGNHE